jgi:histidine triad (HIT) family protein
MSADCVFCKITAGEIPAHKIYEDEHAVAFLDIHPLREYHTLVIPKNHAEFIWDLPEPDYIALKLAAKKVALRLREISGKRYVHERITGVDVPHAHVQLIPFNQANELAGEQDMNSEPDHDVLASQAKKLAF